MRLFLRALLGMLLAETLIGFTLSQFSPMSTHAALLIHAVAMIALAAPLLWHWLRVGDRDRLAAERQLSAALARLQGQKQVLDQHALVSETDAEGRIVYVNASFCRVSGYAARELLGQHHRMLRSDYHPPVFWQDLESAVARSGTWSGEICNRAKDGSYYWLQSTIATLRDEHGRITGYRRAHTDITAQKRQEETLRESEERFRELFDNAPAGYHELDGEGRIVRVNRTELELLGYTEEEMLGRIAADFVENREEAAEAVRGSSPATCPRDTSSSAASSARTAPGSTCC